MPIYLEFNQSTSQFFETTRNAVDDTILLAIDDSQKKLVMTVPTGTGMIAKRAAERQARGITKSGFPVSVKASSRALFEITAGVVLA